MGYERLKFGLLESENDPDMHRLHVDVPTPMWEQLRGNAKVKRLMGRLASKQRRALSFHDVEGNKRVFINDKRIGASGMKPALTVGVAAVLNQLHTMVGTTGRDPLISAQFGLRPLPDGKRLGMRVELAWPDEMDAILANMATERMVSAAAKLRYGDRAVLPDVVSASVDRQHGGIVLSANTFGVSNVGSHSIGYRPEEPRITLTSHNLYRHEEQLICLVGAVAIAHAAELVKE